MQRMTRKKPESLQEATPTTVQERHKRKVSAAAAQQQKQKATNEKKKHQCWTQKDQGRFVRKSDRNV